jgi:carbamoyl-phosphate synthase large subunit
MLIHSSYVLSGAAMNVVHEESALEYNLSAAASVSPLHPVVITKFLQDAQEIDVDAVAHQGNLIVHAIRSHSRADRLVSQKAFLLLRTTIWQVSLSHRRLEIGRCPPIQNIRRQ